MSAQVWLGWLLPPPGGTQSGSSPGGQVWPEITFITALPCILPPRAGRTFQRLTGQKVARVTGETARIIYEVASMAGEMARMAGEIARVAGEVARVTYEMARVTDKVARMTG